MNNTVWVVNDLSGLLGDSQTYLYADEKKARRHFEELKGELMNIIENDYPEDEEDDVNNDEMCISKDEIWVSGCLLSDSDCHVSIGWLEVK